MSDETIQPTGDAPPADVVMEPAVEPAVELASDSVIAPAVSAIVAPLDLDRIEADLAAVEVALARLDSGEYWRDEVTGQPLDDALLAADPLTRRAT